MVQITANSLLDVRDFIESVPGITKTAARLAINTTAKSAVVSLRKSMKAEVNFPQGYVEDPSRFGQTAFATEDNLSASITARFRPTSLARFSATSFQGAKRTGGVKVQVRKAGAPKLIPGSFFIKLRSGTDIKDGFNIGLALRLRPGQSIIGRHKGVSGVQIAPNLYLLYGPSVDQVFRDVSAQQSPQVADGLQAEFMRQFIRLAGN